jgi:hypothetical protein
MRSFKVIIFILLLSFLLQAKTALGHRYTVIRDNSPYAATDGDLELRTIAKGTVVRLIKDETVAETLLFAPFRILRIMVNIEPRGNWLIEDPQGNRGYMWDSDLAYLKR